KSRRHRRPAAAGPLTPTNEHDAKAQNGNDGGAAAQVFDAPVGTLGLRPLGLRLPLRRAIKLDAGTGRVTARPNSVGDPLGSKPASEIGPIHKGLAAPHDSLCRLVRRRGVE